MFFRSLVIPFAITVLYLHFLLAPVAAADQSEAEEFGIKEEPVRKETILDLIFGSTPGMPTERGILVIDAFEDLDNNGKKDDSEPELRNEITCQIDKIDYSIPAFIPGLDYNNRYEIRCSGNNYYPTMPDKEILIEHRGHVIEIQLPCRISKNHSTPD
jgi:hypothetical protein